MLLLFVQSVVCIINIVDHEDLYLFNCNSVSGAIRSYRLPFLSLL